MTHLYHLNVKEKYMDSVKSRYNRQNENGNSKCVTLREALVTSEIEIIPKKNRQKKKKMDDRWNSWHDEKETKNQC